MGCKCRVVRAVSGREVTMIKWVGVGFRLFLSQLLTCEVAFQGVQYGYCAFSYCHC